jgi:hypothetical protein
MGKITPNFADYARQAALGNSALNPLGFSTLPVAVEKPLKIALVGTAPSSRHLAPFKDLSWTIWACSPGNMNQIERWDAWFEIHCNLMWPENRHYGEPYLEWLRKQTLPVYMQDQKEVPNAITYPKDEMVTQFGRYFFTSSFAWMAALAIAKGAKEIGFYGIDMASKDEYVLQRSGGHYFIELARQRGIKVIVPDESDLAQPPPLYGYSENSAFGRKVAARRAEIRGRIGQMTGERDKLNANLTYLQGADEDMDYIQSIWSGVVDDNSRLENENARLRVEIEGYKATAELLSHPENAKALAKSLTEIGSQAAE